MRDPWRHTAAARGARDVCNACARRRPRSMARASGCTSTWHGLGGWARALRGDERAAAGVGVARALVLGVLGMLRGLCAD